MTAVAGRRAGTTQRGATGTMPGAARSILLTRPAGRSRALAARLRADGLRVHVAPTVATEPIEEAVTALVAALSPAASEPVDWLVVTSALGARIAIDALARAGRAAGDGRPRLAAVGPATGAVLERAGWPVAAMPPDARGAAIAEAIAAVDPLAGRRVLLARADASGPDLPDALRARGALVDDRPVYRTIEAPPESAAALREALLDPALGAIVIGSGSAVRGLVRLAGPADDGGSTPAGPADVRARPLLAARLRLVPIVSIGPTTSAAVRAAGLAVAVEATRPNDAALLDAIHSLVPLTDRRPSR